MSRLDQLLAARGFGSRREVSALVRAGLVQVNGETVRRAELKINPACDCVTLRGEAVDLREHVYIMLHKPRGVVSATRDAQPTVLDFCRNRCAAGGCSPLGGWTKTPPGCCSSPATARFRMRCSARAGVLRRLTWPRCGMPLRRAMLRRSRLGLCFLMANAACLRS